MRTAASWGRLRVHRLRFSDKLKIQKKADDAFDWAEFLVCNFVKASPQAKKRTDPFIHENKDVNHTAKDL